MKKILKITGKIFKTIFDVVRTLIYTALQLVRLSVVSAGIVAVLYTIYKAYQLYGYMSTKGWAIPVIVVVYVALAISSGYIIYVGYGLVMLVWELIYLLFSPLEDHNDILSRIQYKLYMLRYKLTPTNKDKVAHNLGFASWDAYLKYEEQVDPENHDVMRIL